MSKQDDIAGLVRAVRARVPMDAAQMLVKETPERDRDQRAVGPDGGCG